MVDRYILGQRIRQAREEQGWSQQQLADRIEYSKAAVNHWESGRSEPGVETVTLISKVTGKPLSFFYGFDPESVVREKITQEVRRDMAGFVGVKILPVVGRISAGIPILAEQNIEEYLPVPRELADRADFILRVKGDSMVGAGIYNGDYVLIRQTDQAVPGDIVVALVNGDDATLKFLRYGHGQYWLEAANPNYQPIPVDKEVHIQGVYVGLFTQRELSGSGAAVPSKEELIDLLARSHDIDPDLLREGIEIARILSEQRRRSGP